MTPPLAPLKGGIVFWAPSGGKSLLGALEWKSLLESLRRNNILASLKVALLPFHYRER